MTKVPLVIQFDRSEYPGLEVVVRQAMDRASTGLPPDVRVGIMFAFHLGAGGGLAWIAGTHRDDAISLVTEWLAEQAKRGHADVVRAAMQRWFKGEATP